MKFKYSKEVVLIIVGLLIVAAVHYALISGTPPVAPGPSAPVPAAGPIEVRGKMTCLPHRDASGPQTMECAFGLQDELGRHYGLRDTDPGYKNVSGVPMGTDVIVSGRFTPKEDEKYQSIGIIEVTEITTR